MWLQQTIDGPVRGTCSRPSNRQENQSLIGGSATVSAIRYQGSVAQPSRGRNRRSSAHAPGSAAAATRSFTTSPITKGYSP